MSGIHDELADALVEVLAGLLIGGKQVNAYKWADGGIRRPSAVVELPTIRRTQPDEREDHIGADDWRLVYPVAFYVGMGKNPREAQARLAQGVVDFIDAIDARTPRLTELSADLKVTEATPFAVEAQADKITLIGYETTVSILTFR
jgi:hypothetical protein